MELSKWKRLREGQFDNGLKKGQGIYKWGSESSQTQKGDVYEGEFNNDTMHGIGTYKYADL